jgi:NADH-quinone oxidoreductase subunit N
MSSEFLYSLLAEHLLLALLLVLMVLEMMRVDRRIANVLVRLVLVVACLVLVRQSAQGYTAVIVPDEIRSDAFGLRAKQVILGCALLLSLVRPVGHTFKSAFLFVSSLLGAMIVLDSTGFISLFMGIEMLSLPAFALIVHDAGSTPASEGAFKYLLLSSVASALLLFGIALSYGGTGTLTISDFASLVGQGTPLAVAAGILVASGLFLKAALFPFHGWAPDAYSGARLPVTGFLASVVKGAVILALVRILGGEVLKPATASIVAILSILSILYGNVAAIRQRTFRRLLAYSSIAHAGYMVFALVDVTGARADDLLWYVGIYASMVILASASFGVICPGEDDEVQRLDGAFTTHPVAALVFGFAMLSLAGVPPLPGFFAKLFVFRSVIASGYLWPAVIAFVGSFIGVTYYLGLFYRLFDRDSRLTAPDSPGGRTS